MYNDTCDNRTPLAIPEVDVVPDVNSRMASALDILLISLSRSGDDGNRDDDDCGGDGGNDGNDSSADLTQLIPSVR
jgi:hypothetical protein